MPQYVYGCVNGHTKELTLKFSQLDKSIVLCDDCEDVMHRIPQAFMVNWGGLPPHKADARPPQIAKYVSDSPEILSRTRDAKAKRSEIERKTIKKTD